MAKRFTLSQLKKRELQLAAPNGAEPLPGGSAQEAGKEAHEAGEAFQDRLDHYHAGLLRRVQVIKVFRQYPKLVATWVRGQIMFAMQKGEKGPCDYAVIFVSGQAGLFDAKSSAGLKQFTWPKEQAHQLAELRRLHQGTAGRSPAFALVYWRTHEEVRIHPIVTIEDRTVYRDVGILTTDVNWLPVVLRHWSIK